LLCPLCNQEDEVEWHIFFTCEASAQARYYAGLDNILVHRVQQLNSVKEVIFSIVSNEDKVTAGLFAVMMWVLWSNRNSQLVWEESCESGCVLGYMARQDPNSTKAISGGKSLCLVGTNAM
jgi:hypothetical protein